MSVRRSPWIWLLALPMVFGGLLVVHGYAGHPSIEHGSVGHEAAAPAPTHEERCVECAAGHVLLACAAILTAAAGLARLRRIVGRSGVVRVVRGRTSSGAAVVASARSPDPPWNRLSVLRC